MKARYRSLFLIIVVDAMNTEKKEKEKIDDAFRKQSKRTERACTVYQLTFVQFIE